MALKNLPRTPQKGAATPEYILIVALVLGLLFLLLWKQIIPTLAQRIDDAGVGISTLSKNKTAGSKGSTTGTNPNLSGEQYASNGGNANDAAGAVGGISYGSEVLPSSNSVTP